MRASAPFHLLVKPSGAACNLDCHYCFFLGKQALSPDRRPRMSDAMLERVVEQLLQTQPGAEVEIAWQGGEPTLMGLPFFRRAVELAARHRRPGQRVRHTLQTNGVLIDDEWARFLAQQGFLVGLSLDGPQPLHDVHRVNKAGQGSFARVRRAWDTLQRHAVETNLLCCVHAANAGHALDVYRFFRDDLRARHLQFIPVVERAEADAFPGAASGAGCAQQVRSGDEVPARSDGLDGLGAPGVPETRPRVPQQGERTTDRSVTAGAWGRFLITVFDEWVRRDVGQVFVRAFDGALANWVGQPSQCVFAPSCGRQLALGHDGDVYACDHYFEPGYRLGNLSGQPLAELVDQPAQRRFGQDKFDTLPPQCRTCDVLFACYGECPRNRFATCADGTPGLSVLCEGYRAFFRHIAPTMQRMVELLRAGRTAADIMLGDGPGHPAARNGVQAHRPGRNDPCPCGSGAKYKRCHGR